MKIEVQKTEQLVTKTIIEVDVKQVPRTADELSALFERNKNSAVCLADGDVVSINAQYSFRF